MRKFTFLLIVFLCACSSKYDVVKVRINNNTVKAEIADTLDKQALGLMYRQKLEMNKGMLFPYDEEAVQSFWMKNTLIDLDIIFISDSKTVNCVYKKVPRSTLTTPEANVAIVSCPAQYVLELAAGAADKYNIAPGTKIEFELK